MIQLRTIHDGHGHARYVTLPPHGAGDERGPGLFIELRNAAVRVQRCPGTRVYDLATGLQVDVKAVTR